WRQVPADALRNVIFHLGLIEVLSYWKATCSPVIQVNAGSLSSAQITWWKDLLFHGMGEFFFRNDIDFTLDDLVEFRASAPAFSLCYTGSLSQRSLVTIGGGRDSALAAILLKTSNQPFRCMMLNPAAAATEIAATACPNPSVTVRRQIAPELLELNRQG